MKVFIFGGLLAHVVLPIPTASANVFSNFQSGEIEIRGVATCVSNNAFDFQTSGSASPCGNRDLGKLGKVLVTSTSGDFSTGAFSKLAGSYAQLADLAFPGVTFFSGNQISGASRSLLRLDLNRDGKFGKGDVVFEAQAFAFSQDSSLRVRIDVAGNFREVVSVENAGTASERIVKTPFKLDVQPRESNLRAAYTTPIQNLWPVGFFGDVFNPLDPSASLVSSFYEVPREYKLAPVFDLRLTVGN